MSDSDDGAVGAWGARMVMTAGHAAVRAVRLRRYCAAAILLAAGLTIAGCANLTKVAEPDIVPPSAFDNPSGALTRRDGAIGDFAEAYSDQTFFTGLFTDELSDIGSQTYVDDQRSISQLSEGYPYQSLSGVRIDALRAIAALQRYNPTPPWHIGEMFAYLGYVETMFAENLCSGTPLGVVVSDKPEIGPTVSRQVLLGRALADFDSAQRYAAANDSITRLVLVGRARALVDSDDFAAAAAAVAAVPTTFAYQTAHEAAAQPNTWYTRLSQSLGVTVSDREGINGLPFASGHDPRITLLLVGQALNGASVYTFAPYATGSSPITLATGVEGQLIVAEAALHSGDIATWASVLNALRANYPDTSLSSHPLPADSTTSASPTTRLAVMFRERAFWLFGTGHRHGDLRRLVRQYGMSVSSVFPTGPYPLTASVYGSAVVYVPTNESYNPNYHGCLDVLP